MIKSVEEFNSIISTKRVLIDFYADWCGPCKMMGSILEDIKEIEVIKVNVDELPDLARKYGVMSIPTLILFDNGKEKEKLIGLHAKDEILEYIKR